MSSLADKNLSKGAQDKINSITEQAKSGQISWAKANEQANAVRASEGANYTVSAGGTTSYKDGSSISSYKTGSKVTGGGSAQQTVNQYGGGSSGAGANTPSYAAPVQAQSQIPALNQYGFRDNFDYSAAINAAKAQGQDTTQLEAERKQKIKTNYGNVEPNMYGADKPYSQLTGENSSWQNQDVINNAVVIANTSKNNAIKAQMEKEAQAGNWDKVGALVNELAVPDGRYGGYNLAYANQV